MTLHSNKIISVSRFILAPQYRSHFVSMWISTLFFALVYTAVGSTDLLPALPSTPELTGIDSEISKINENVEKLTKMQYKPPSEIDLARELKGKEMRKRRFLDQIGESKIIDNFETLQNEVQNQTTLLSDVIGELTKPMTFMKRDIRNKRYVVNPFFTPQPWLPVAPFGNFRVKPTPQQNKVYTDNLFDSIWSNVNRQLQSQMNPFRFRRSLWPDQTPTANENLKNEDLEVIHEEVNRNFPWWPMSNEELKNSGGELSLMSIIKDTEESIPPNIREEMKKQLSLGTTTPQLAQLMMNEPIKINEGENREKRDAFFPLMNNGANPMFPFLNSLNDMTQQLQQSIFSNINHQLQEEMSWLFPAAGQIPLGYNPKSNKNTDQRYMSTNPILSVISGGTPNMAWAGTEELKPIVSTTNIQSMPGANQASAWSYANPQGGITAVSHPGAPNYNPGSVSVSVNGHTMTSQQSNDGGFIASTTVFDPKSGTWKTYYYTNNDKQNTPGKGSTSPPTIEKENVWTVGSEGADSFKPTEKETSMEGSNIENSKVTAKLIDSLDEIGGDIQKTDSEEKRSISTLAQIQELAYASSSGNSAASGKAYATSGTATSNPYFAIIPALIVAPLIFI